MVQESSNVEKITNLSSVAVVPYGKYRPSDAPSVGIITISIYNFNNRVVCVMSQK